MKGATYVTVEADAAFVMPMNASGEMTTTLFSIEWTSNGIQGKGWEWSGGIVVNNPEGDIEAQINTYLAPLSFEKTILFLEYWAGEGCAGKA